MQWVVGQVLQGHGWGEGWAWGRGGVGEASQGVLIPPKVHIVVQPLQGLQEAGVGQLKSVTGKPLSPMPPSLASAPSPRLTTRGCWVCSDINCPRGAM